MYKTQRKRSRDVSLQDRYDWFENSEPIVITLIVTPLVFSIIVDVIALR